MQLSGSKSFPTSPAQTYALLTNPDVLMRAMPGLKSLTARSATLYEAVIEVGVAAIKGTYQGTLEMKDVTPGQGYRMVVHGEGALGFMDADVRVDLVENEASGTDLTYEGEAKVGGTVAGVGQRVLSGVAKLIINQFFNGLLKEAEKTQATS